MRVVRWTGAAAIALAAACTHSTPAQAPTPTRPQPQSSPAQSPNAQTSAGAQGGQPPAIATSIASRTGGMERRAGLIPLYLDERQGKLYIEIPRDSMRVLAFFLQSTGLGSNPIGIDRGANGPDHVARFDRNGDRVLVVFENWNYRATSPTRSRPRDDGRRVVPGEHRRSASAARGAGREAARGRDRLRLSRLARRIRYALAHQRGHVHAGAGPLEHRPRVHEGVPREHARSTSR